MIKLIIGEGFLPTPTGGLRPYASGCLGYIQDGWAMQTHILPSYILCESQHRRELKFPGNYSFIHILVVFIVIYIIYILRGKTKKHALK